MSTEATSMWRRLVSVAVELTRRLPVDGPIGAVSVGLPDSADLSTERNITTVARVGYDRLFASIDTDVYAHSFGGLVESGADMTGTDIQAAFDGVISITPVDGAGYSPEALPLAAALMD
jgi:hypothetical protein